MINYLRRYSVVAALQAMVFTISMFMVTAVFAKNDFLDLSLEELMNIKVDTAGNSASSWRAQPGIITVFSAADIQAMGARTLKDVLLHIPGVSLGMDTQNAVNLVVRGNWAFEGKIQYQINDIPVNDLVYGTFSLPPYLPAEQLDRVEILRGPGSVKYGDSAQLAVIRIYTHNLSRAAQISVSDFHQMPQTGSKQASANTRVLSFNNQFSVADTSMALAGSANQGHWGAGSWVDHQGTAVDVSTIATEGANLAATLNRDATQVQLYYSSYNMNNVQQYGTYAPSAHIWFREITSTISHEFQLAANWQLRPKLSYRDEANWRSKSQFPDIEYYYDLRATRFDGRLDAIHSFSDDASITLGFYRELETARPVDVGVAPELYYPPSGTLKQSATTAYTNWDFSVYDVDFSLGARTSTNYDTGSSLIPRLGLTRANSDWHFKWLYGGAYREPDLQTSNPVFHPGTEKLKPESSRVQELEFGHVLGSSSYLTLSVFDQKIEDAIIYAYEPGYSNNPTIKTKGAEVQYWYKGDNVTLQMNYSYAQANDDKLPAYDVIGRSGQNLGAAKHIANVWLSWRTPVQDLSVQLDARYLGSRYAYVYSFASAGILQQKMPVEMTLNLSLSYELAPVTFNLGVHNIGNRKQYIPQPYKDVSTPFPVDGRELWLRAQWSLAH